MCPTYNIVIGKKAYKVELTRKGEGTFKAEINGKLVKLEFEKDETSVLSTHTIKVSGRIYQVAFERVDRHTPFTLRVNDVPFEVKLREPAERKTPEKPVERMNAPFAKANQRRGPIPVRSVHDEGIATAPMAGKIVSVKVNKGDFVEAGDVVCILEAMKMENEIAAAKAGKVQEVKVTEGTSVNKGDILIVIK